MRWLAIIGIAMFVIAVFVLPQDTAWPVVVSTVATLILLPSLVCCAFSWIGGPSNKEHTLSELLGVKPDDNNIFPF